MRISDWSSDVCSSDLRRAAPGAPWGAGGRPRARRHDPRPHQGHRTPPPARRRAAGDLRALVGARLRAPAALAVSAGSVIVPRMIARGFAALSVLLLAGCVSQPELAREGTYDRADTLFDPARAIQQDWTVMPLAQDGETREKIGRAHV